MSSVNISTNSIQDRSQADTIIAYSPVKLDSSDLKVLQSHLQFKYSISAPIISKIDPTLIAGVRVIYQDKELDYSLLGKLKRLSKELQ